MKVFGKIVFWRLGVTLAGKGREKEQATVGREGNDAGARHSLEFGKREGKAIEFWSVMC